MNATIYCKFLFDHVFENITNIDHMIPEIDT